MAGIGPLGLNAVRPVEVPVADVAHPPDNLDTPDHTELSELELELELELEPGRTAHAHVHGLPGRPSLPAGEDVPGYSPWATWPFLFCDPSSTIGRRLLDVCLSCGTVGLWVSQTTRYGSLAVAFQQSPLL